MEISGSKATGVGLTQRDSPAKIHKAAQDFEALMIGQMLKSVRESSFGGGWGTSGSDQAGDIGLEMAEQQMAQMLATNGGLGLASIISKGLEQRAASLAPPPTTSAPGASKL